MAGLNLFYFILIYVTKSLANSQKYDNGIQLHVPILQNNPIPTITIINFQGVLTLINLHLLIINTSYYTGRYL